MPNSAIIVCGFPGGGKTHCYIQKGGPAFLDSDSSKFSWIKPGVRNNSFPWNYINYIQDNLDCSEMIFISTHKEVRNALRIREIPFTLVYPEASLREEYMQR